ncbi:hypothetical protein [Sphingomonas baiyangensis]|uniref:DUF2336 domain-containing protein n=1 Tax=Sphingomonas baiyangensis TaxID=2572576 RepID=A0A4U1L1N5_9SPHN|nr:hypothetical protein [Sphingomonas baiyangensis]TKD50502.1 hypothetical protein FBR43_06790 [Sphingomonas baiyangensis]
MSLNPADPRDAPVREAALLIADAAAADVRTRAIRTAALRDFLAEDCQRLDDRTRVAFAALLRTIVATIGGAIHGDALERLSAAGNRKAHAALNAVEAAAICPRLYDHLLSDEAMAAALLDRVVLDLIAERLPEALIERSESEDPFDTADMATEASAVALRALEARRRGPVDQPPYAVDLDAETQFRCAWGIAAAIAVALAPVDAAARSAIEWALADATERALARHDDEDRLEAAATRFAVMRDLPLGRVAEAIEIALADGRIVLATALVAHALALSFEDVRAMIVDPRDTRLWLGLRALDLPRDTVARIGYALSEADPRRDVEAFADRIEAIMQIDPNEAAAALEHLRLPAPFRAATMAIRALGK